MDEAATPFVPPASGVRGGVHAAVDVGSNSVHLLVASVLGGRLEASLDDRSAFLGLGAAADGWRFGPELRSTLVDALLGYAAVAVGLGAETVTFAGTEPLRRAADASTVVCALDRAGWPLHVLAHEEEALLTLLGATGGRRVDEEIAVVDVGGGSSELAFAGPRHPPIATGTRAGAARLWRSAVAHDPPTRDELASIRRHASELLSGVPGPPASVAAVTAVGGTASNVVKVLALADGTPPDPWLTRDRLERAVTLLLEAPADATAERFLLNPTRARVLPAGAAILEALLYRFGVDGVSAADVGIREGTILAVARAGVGWRDRLPVLASGWDDEGQGDSPASHPNAERRPEAERPGAA